ncbi:uncharacterized protein CNTROB isoform X2 [Latimeria chalumnae]|uniref:uncharacterized protein CNTROB isoform X2 n=1 Tax=Latimeria chalumnae TaxID=7897 RepID=UPI00313BDFFA
MDTSVCSEDLLSDVEPLPASAPSSAPTTPVSVRTPGGSPALADPVVGKTAARSLPPTPTSTAMSSSEVTARLHASLQEGRETEAKVCSKLDWKSPGLRAAGERSKDSASPLSCKQASPHSNPFRHVTFQDSTPEPLGSEGLHDPDVQMDSLYKSACGRASPSPSAEAAVVRDRASESFLSGSVSWTWPPGLNREPLGPPEAPQRLSRARISSSLSVNSGVERSASSSPKPLLTGKVSPVHRFLVNSPNDPEVLSQGNKKLAVRTEDSDLEKVASRHISDMESVRSHLQSMLKVSQDRTQRDYLVSFSAPAVPASAPEKDDDSFESDSTVTLLNANPLIDISPPASSVASIEGLFPRYSRLRSTVTNASTAHTETRILKESLEKERTRRKHCEKQIQTLQNKILTLQQQLAVAVSADRKKDIMIEQLDKTLAKVVEGWKKHEAEKDEVTRRLQEERDVAEKTKAEQQEVMSNFEESLSQAVESMMKEQQLRSRLQEEMSRLEEENRKLLAQLESEKSRSRVLQAERDEAVQARLHKEKQLEAVRSTLEEQREIWAERERRLKQQILQLEEELQTKLEVEKIKLQKEVQRAEDCQQVLSSVQSDVQQLESELDTVRRERDNFQLEISLLQARLESQKSQLESEFKVSLELQLTERLAKLHEDSARQAATLREQHRKQILELTSHHENEMAKQLTEFKLELTNREERQQQLVQDYETRLASNEEEIRNNQATRRRLEAQRAEMVKKFQALWQSHWNDALRLLMSDASQVARQNQMHHIKPNTASAEPQGISSGSVNYHMLPSIPLSSIAGSFQPFHISDTQQLHSVYRQQESPGNSRVRHAIHAEHEANSRQQPHASHRSADNPAAFNSSVSHNAVPQAIPLQPALQLSSPRPGAAVVSFGSSGGHSATGGDASHRSSAGHGQRQGAEEPRRTGSDQPSSHLSSLQSHSISATVPSPLGGRSRERQSPVLNQSAQSQQGFHDLQPQMDETSLSAGLLSSRRPDTTTPSFGSSGTRNVVGGNTTQQSMMAPLHLEDLSQQSSQSQHFHPLQAHMEETSISAGPLSSRRPDATSPSFGSSGTRNVFSGSTAQQSTMAPVLESSGRLEELSHVLTHSAPGQQSFHPLQANMEETSISAGPLSSRRPDTTTPSFGSSGTRNVVGGNTTQQSMMAPLHLEDLSQQSSQSQHFHPLQAHMEETSISDELAERPFTDDSGGSVFLAVNPGRHDGAAETNRGLEAKDRQSREQQELRQAQLQHYIQVLLDRCPGNPLRDRCPGESSFQYQREAAPVVRDRSTSTRDNVRSPPAGQPPAARMPGPSSAAVHKVKIPVSETVLRRSVELDFPLPGAAPDSQGGVLSPGQVGEVSRLLRVYHADPGGPLPAVEELFAYLRDTRQCGSSAKDGPAADGATNANIHKQQEYRLNQPAKKEVLPAQPAPPRRPSSARPAPERSTGKTLKRQGSAAQQTSKASKSVVWR